MADNLELNAGSGGETVATDDVGGVHYQRVKIDGGGDGATAPIGGDNANGLDVDVTRSALPTGASTAANQTTIIGHLDGVEGLLTTIDGDTGSIATSIASVDGKITAVDTGAVVVASSALPTGASTAAKQPALGTAGTASTDVITVQGIASMTKLLVTPDLPTGASTAANQTTIIGHVDGIEALLTTINAALVTGLSVHKSIDLDESEEEVKDTAGVVHFIVAFNATAAPLWLKGYFADADDVTVGTTVPDITLMVPANADSDGAGFVLPIPPCGIAFANAITFACTTGRADNDSGAPGAGDCTVLIGYK